MTDQEIVFATIRALDAAGVEYMVVGSLSSNAYGFPRATQDADLVMKVDAASVSSLAKQLPEPLRLDPQMSFETVTGTNRFVVNAKRSHYKVELFLLSDDPHDRERFRRRVRGEAFGQSVWLPTPEDVIISKLRWSKHGKRSKDVEDIKGVLLVQRGKLDDAYLNRWCEVHETRDLLESIRLQLSGSS